MRGDGGLGRLGLLKLLQQFQLPVDVQAGDFAGIGSLALADALAGCFRFGLRIWPRRRHDCPCTAFLKTVASSCEPPLLPSSPSRTMGRVLSAALQKLVKMQTAAIGNPEHASHRGPLPNKCHNR